jgi:alpha-galactosidase
VSSGLINFGYQYVNLDEGWEGPRSTSSPYGPFNPGPLTGNSKFPDVPGLISYVHGLNLKFGLYSTPRAVGYSGFTGGTYVTPDTDAAPNGENLLASPQDVQQLVDWGVDYLKYDGDDEGDVDVQTTSATVHSATRDIVYSLSQNTGANFTEASTVSSIGNSWRTAFDMVDE